MTYIPLSAKIALMNQALDCKFNFFIRLVFHAKHKNILILRKQPTLRWEKTIQHQLGKPTNKLLTHIPWTAGHGHSISWNGTHSHQTGERLLGQCVVLLTYWATTALPSCRKRSTTNWTFIKCTVQFHCFHRSKNHKTSLWHLPRLLHILLTELFPPFTEFYLMWIVE